MAAWADECTGFNHMHCRKMNNSFIYSLFCSFKYSFYYYTLGPILSTEESVVNKDELKFLPYGSKSCERESINWMTLETQIIWISCGDTWHKGEVLGVCCHMSWRKHRVGKGLKKDGAAESQEGRGLWYLLRRGDGWGQTIRAWRQC